MSRSNKQFEPIQNNMFEGLEEPSDDVDYDKLNEETFGDNLLIWDEDKETRDAESYDAENNRLSTRVASVILEDESDDQSSPPKSAIPVEQLWKPATGSKVFTLEEIEANMKHHALGNRDGAVEAFEPLAENKFRGVVNPNPGVSHTNLSGAEPYYHNFQDKCHPTYPRHFNMSQGQNMPGHPGMMPQIPQFHSQRPRMPYTAQLTPPRYMDPRSVSHHLRRELTCPANKPTFATTANLPVQPRGMNQHPDDDEYIDKKARGFNMPTAPSSSQNNVKEGSGWMKLQEKQWLQSIQIMQLSGNQPLQDDYYFVMYNHIKQGNSARKVGNLHVTNSKEASKPLATYIPQQFENSLGKLQVGSVTAPRKIIDMDLVETPNIDAQSKPEKKSKQQLMEIEEMYNYLLELEEAASPLFQTAGLVKDTMKAHLQEKLLGYLLPDGKLVSVMGIRKGRKLVSRVLPVITNINPLITKLLEEVVTISKRDLDETLLLFLPYVRNFLDNKSLESLVEIANRCDTEFLLSTKFSTSLVAKMVERAWQVFDTCEDELTKENWKKVLVRLAESSDYWVERNRPVIAIDRDLLSQHLSVASGIDGASITKLLKVLGHNLLPQPAI